MEERQETLGSWEAVIPVEPGRAEQWRGGWGHSKGNTPPKAGGKDWTSG